MSNAHPEHAYVSFNRTSRVWIVVQPRGHSVIVLSTWKRLTDASCACDEHNFPHSMFNTLGVI